MKLPPHEDVTTVGAVHYYHRLTQRSDEWHELRLGMITASQMDQILTPTLKFADNKKTRIQFYELAAQRITKYVEQQFVSYDMERGLLQETDARIEYEKHFAPVAECGFVINDSLGFDIGFSPDGLVGEDGQIEIKSRMAKFQVATIMEHMAAERHTPIPIEFMLQVQTGLFVTGRKWCDFVSFSNGFCLLCIRVFPDADYFTAITQASAAAEQKISHIVASVTSASDKGDIFPVARVDYSLEIAL